MIVDELESNEVDFEVIDVDCPVPEGAVMYENDYERYYRLDGRLVGPNEGWYDLEKKIRRMTACFNKDGNMDGLRTSWYENGTKKEERNYKDGELDGLLTFWGEDGDVWYICTYSNGVLVGCEDL